MVILKSSKSIFSIGAVIFSVLESGSVVASSTKVDAKEFITLTPPEQVKILSIVSKETAEELLIDLQIKNKHDERNDKSIILAMGYAYPEHQGQWDRHITFNGLSVMGDDQQIDLTRIQYKPLEYDESIGRYFIHVDGVKHIKVHSSRFRMNQGQSPIARDGLPLRVCRFSEGPNALYFEIDQTAMNHLKTEMKMTMPIKQACIKDEYLADYWKQRVNQFVSPYGHLRNQDHTLEPVQP
ncbi:hypothetical protein AB6D11_03065 [Vibrio splendidus]